MAEPYTQTVIILPLATAVLCEDCHSLSNGMNVCPACGSGAISKPVNWMSERREGTTSAQTNNQETLQVHL